MNRSAFRSVMCTPVCAMGGVNSSPSRSIARLLPLLTFVSVWFFFMPAAQAQHSTPVSSAPGQTYPWEGSVAQPTASSVAGTNTANGNKLTSIPIVGWTARGGLPVQMTLYHNSQGSHNSELGQKWTFTYDIYLVLSDDDFGNYATVHWGDDLAYKFTQSGSSFTPPTGHP